MKTSQERLTSDFKNSSHYSDYLGDGMPYHIATFISEDCPECDDDLVRRRVQYILDELAKK